ncbi:hypothetical protein TSOC_000218 [Tetrabaena socialis]|uniref:Uncharacterized protein n=1 Tax=Tetrabaena socialis TaxID=47790 RepID=A0A2J8AK07_9CHLO|nr:hypothetical protein TSOC_000218 [Tetrabaena socialis]|eukprot:PNH12856.1 hypothetical protein TSOC_000218 [Tetrabaena socialis]
MAVVLALLRVGADKDAQNTFGWTALHEASKEGHAAVVEALLMAGADNEIKNDPSPITELLNLTLDTSMLPLRRYWIGSNLVPSADDMRAMCGA